MQSIALHLAELKTFPVRHQYSHRDVHVFSPSPHTHYSPPSSHSLCPYSTPSQSGQYILMALPAGSGTFKVKALKRDTSVKNRVQINVASVLSPPAMSHLRRHLNIFIKLQYRVISFTFKTMIDIDKWWKVKISWHSCFQLYGHQPHNQCLNRLRTMWWIQDTAENCLALFDQSGIRKEFL